MKFLRVKDLNGRDLMINPAAISYIQPQGEGSLVWMLRGAPHSVQESFLHLIWALAPEDE